ncbi:hypothetical protein NHX12_022621, partial [Muraenolepis orangiensis]
AMFVSKSDCCVTVDLPTASATARRTETVVSRKNPEWNETFSFRLHRHVKNIVELKLCDEDILVDDLIATILFDVNNLVEGRKETKIFTSHKGDLEGTIKVIHKEITKSFASCVSPSNLDSYHQEMKKSAEGGHLVSLIDLTNSTLSDQERAVNRGQNPLPIYTAVNVKDSNHGDEVEAEWCEFTPYKVGLSKYGAFISTRNFGSQFFLGHLLRKLPELSLSSLLGIWSSAISVSYGQIWKMMTGAKPEVKKDVDKIEAIGHQSTINTYILKPLTRLSETVTHFFHSRQVVAETYNFMHWKYSEHQNFNAWKDAHPDAFPN